MTSGNDRHTKEPWVLGKEKRQKNSPLLMITINEATAIVTTNPDDARRTIACVNRCAGMSTEFLENDVDLFTPKNLLIEQNEQLKKKNTDLVLGIRQVIEDCKQSKRLASTLIYLQGLVTNHEG